MIKIKSYLAIFICILLQPSIAVCLHPRNFQEAKRLARIIWDDHRISVYCGCDYDKQLIVDFKSCGYQPKNYKRANRIEWEHIVPASWYGRQRICWQEPICTKKNGKSFKGRKCCEQIDPEFRKFYTDLHNLVPIIGEVNAARKDYRFGEFYPEGKQRFQYHGCEIYISDHYRTVEPSSDVKGLIARAHLYVSDTYGLKLSKNQLQMFDRWNRCYPPSNWEVTWNEKIRKIQGNDNPYISEHLT